MHAIHDEPDTAAAMPLTTPRTINGEYPVVLGTKGEHLVFLGIKGTWNNLRRVLLSRDLVVQFRRQIVTDGTIYKKLKGYVSKLGYESTD